MSDSSVSLMQPKFDVSLPGASKGKQRESKMLGGNNSSRSCANGRTPKLGQTRVGRAGPVPKDNLQTTSLDPGPQDRRDARSPPLSSASRPPANGNSSPPRQASKIPIAVASKRKNSTDPSTSVHGSSGPPGTSRKRAPPNVLDEQHTRPPSQSWDRQALRRQARTDLLVGGSSRPRLGGHHGQGDPRELRDAELPSDSSVVFSGIVQNVRITQYHSCKTPATGAPVSTVALGDGTERETDLTDTVSVSDSAPEPGESQPDGEPDTPITVPDTSDDENFKPRTADRGDAEDAPFAVEAWDTQLSHEALERKLHDEHVNRGFWKEEYEYLKSEDFGSPKRPLEDRIEDPERKKERVSADAATCAQQPDEPSDYIRCLEDELAETRRENKSLKSILAATERHRDELQNKFLKGQLPVFVVEELQGKLDAAKGENARLEQHNTRLEDEKCREQQEKEALRRRIKTVDSQVEKQPEDVSLHQEVEERQQENNSLYQQLRKQQQQHSSLHQKVVTLSRQQSALKESNRALESKLGILESELMALTPAAMDPHVPSPPGNRRDCGRGGGHGSPGHRDRGRNKKLAPIRRADML